MSHQDRDASMERLLREVMRTTSADVRSPSDCLDAETLAAWSEGALGDPQRALAEAHASQCSRCQALLAAMARTAPPVTTSSPSRWRWWMTMLVPAVAGAAAVSLWFAVDQRSTDRIAGDTGTVSSRAAQERSVPPPSPSAALAPNEAKKDEQDAKAEAPKAAEERAHRVA